MSVAAIAITAPAAAVASLLHDLHNAFREELACFHGCRSYAHKGVDAAYAEDSAAEFEHPASHSHYAAAAGSRLDALGPPAAAGFDSIHNNGVSAIV